MARLEIWGSTIELHPQAQKITTSCGSATVTVCTHHLALFYFGTDFGPRREAKPLHDVEELFAEVVELQHDWVCLAAIDAGMVSEVLKKPYESLANDLAVQGACVIDVSLFD